MPGWRELSEVDFEFSPPRGFSSFTMGVRCRGDARPEALLYRHLDGKENAILDPADEKRVYLTLADHEIAAACFAYEEGYRLEEFYDGRALTARDLRDHDILRGIAEQLAKFHSLRVDLPTETFFERVHSRWGPIARRVLYEERHLFPENEQAMCEELTDLLSPETVEMVRRCIPDDPPVFCHNDTYHGNVMLLADGRVRLLDFEFSCLNHRAFDFSNLFAETVMRHGLPDYPYFSVADPEFRRDDIAVVVERYVECSDDATLEVGELVRQTEEMILLSDYMYAMAALPLAVEPVQKIRFIPYSLRRFRRFRETWRQRFE